MKKEEGSKYPIADARLSRQVVDHAFDAVLHERDVPIQQKTQFQVGELEVCQKLCLVDRQELFNGFVFDDHGLVDQHVDSDDVMMGTLFRCCVVYAFEPLRREGVSLVGSF